MDFYDALLENGTIGMSMEEIASFYSTPEGYRYALMDTMGDILIDVGGAVVGTIASYYLFKFHPELSAKLIYKEKKIQDYKPHHSEHPHLTKRMGIPIISS